MRLFVGIDLPDQVKRELAGICAGVPGARWVAPERMHLTLRFIGAVDGAGFRDLGEALGGIEGEPFDLHVKGVGQFGQGKRVRQLWAGIEENERLAKLQRRVEAAVAEVGVEPERRRFHPHVTLARLRDTPVERVGGFLANHAMFACAPFAVESFVLFSSFLSHSGAIYRAEATYPL